MIQQVVTLEETEDLELYACFNVYYHPEFEAEPGNPNTYVAAGEEYILEKVVLKFGKVNINILPLLSQNDKDEIITLIQQKTNY